MRTRMMVRGVIIIMSIALFRGCGKTEDETKEKEESFSVVNKERMQIKEEGVFYIDGYTELMKFYDFNLAQSIPICDRPNCEHNSAECNAYFAQGFMSGMGCYRDKLYYYDNMDPKLPFYRCNKNGNNRKVLLNLNEEGKYEALSVSLPMFFAGDEAVFALEYFNLLTEPVAAEDGSLIDKEYFWMFGKINLTTGKFEIIKEPEKLAPYTSLEVLDYAEQKVFYYIAAGSSDTWEQHIYDTETNKDKVVEQHHTYLSCFKEENRVFYADSSEKRIAVYEMNEQTGNEKKIMEKEADPGKDIYCSMAGEELLYCIYEEGTGTDRGETFGAYNLKTGEERELTEEEYDYAPFIAATQEWYIGIAEPGRICIRKEDYEKKDWSKMQIIGSF